MKISIIGASGTVGQEVMRTFLLENRSIQFDQLCLFTHSVKGKNRIEGMLYDLEIGNLERKIVIADTPEYLSNSDIVVICAGVPVPMDMAAIKESDKEKNQNNRDLLYSQNKEIVLQWIRYISSYSPNALLILVSNPVSKLLSDIHSECPGLLSVGCGITNDTLRVRNELIKEYPNSNPQHCFVIGSHDLNTQTIALTYFNLCTQSDFSRDVFEYTFTDAVEKRNYIACLKNEQNNIIRQKKISMRMYEEYPLLYRSYFNHRLAHFLYKTHISTAKAVLEIVYAYYGKIKQVSVEVYDEKYNRVVGIPIFFKNSSIVYPEISYNQYELEILQNC